MNNKYKYESYKSEYNLLNQAKENHDLPRCIVAITISESIISDRLQSYLKYKTPSLFISKGIERKYVSAFEMVKECLKLFPKQHIDIKSKSHGKLVKGSLFEDVKNWLSIRNDICHGFVKSNPGSPSKEIGEFHNAAIQAAEEGFKLTKLVSKWYRQLLQKTNKN